MAIERELLDQLLVGRDPNEVFAKDGLLDDLKKALSERILNTELDEHLDDDRTDGSANRRNGHSRKSVLTGTSKMTLSIPRDRAGTFDPKLMAKYQRRFPDFDDKIISMYARGMTVREIRGHLEELYGIDVSPDLISAVTDAVLEEVAEWQNRPLDAVYPLVFFDAIRVKIRDEGFVRNKAVVYDLLFRAASETLTPSPPIPNISAPASASRHRARRRPVARRHALDRLQARLLSACAGAVAALPEAVPRPSRRPSPAGRLAFFGDLAGLADRSAFATALAPLRKAEWIVYAKRPFAGPEAVLAYLSRYTHRVAVSNSRLIDFDDNGVTFRWKDYRARGKAPGNTGIKIMTLSAGEFIRRFLLHVLPDCFHRIRHYGLLASAVRADNIARLRALINGPEDQREPGEAKSEDDVAPDVPRCPCCGGRMTIIEIFARGSAPRTWSPGTIRIDTS